MKKITIEFDSDYKSLVKSVKGGGGNVDAVG